MRASQEDTNEKEAKKKQKTKQKEKTKTKTQEATRNKQQQLDLVTGSSIRPSLKVNSSSTFYYSDHVVTGRHPYVTHSRISAKNKAKTRPKHNETGDLKD